MIPSAEVSAILDSHVEWNMGARVRAMAFISHLPQVMSGGQDTLPAYSELDLREKQLHDKHLSRVVYYVERQRRPSRREREKESMVVIRYLKHWEKLVLRNGVLYRVSCDKLSRIKRHQYVVPESLVNVILKGIHDDVDIKEKVVHRNLLMLVNFLLVNVENSVSDQLSDVSDSCQRLPSVLPLCAVEDETLGREAGVLEHEEESHSSTTMDGSAMTGGKTLSTCDDAGFDDENDGMSVQETGTRERTISWVSDLPDSIQTESDQTLSGILEDPSAKITSVAPDSHTSEAPSDARMSVSGDIASSSSDLHDSEAETVLSAQPHSQTSANTYAVDTKNVPPSSSSVTQYIAAFSQLYVYLFFYQKDFSLAAVDKVEEISCVSASFLVRYTVSDVSRRMSASVVYKRETPEDCPRTLELERSLCVYRASSTEDKKRLEETGDVFDKPRSGRPRKTTAREDRLLARKSKASPFSTAAELHETWSPEVPVSTRTVCRILSRNGLHGRISAQKPALNKRQLKNRVAFAKAHSLLKGWTLEKWQKVDFSDESSVELHHSRRKYCRRPTGARMDPRFTQKTVKFGGGKIMVWGYIQ
ncbi:hypothetical protein QQF64_034000 [Cirrhinus molitorella]|uniref:Transposase Tc1-like domain-containing protein n=1 Tax=Cirrhinus molitorella TaxID=172907 RepID=A0ABR3MVI1_9TELE